MSDITRRVTSAAWPGSEYEIRAVAGGDGRTFRGYAAVFNQESQDLGGFREIIAPGAFTRTLADPRRDVRMFWNHDAGRLLASTSAGTLKLREDARGLLVEARLSDSTDGRDMATLIREGNVRSMSFGFSAAEKDIAWDRSRTVRTVRAADLYEVSPVTGWPAYTGTEASVRDAAALRGSFSLFPLAWTQEMLAELLDEAGKLHPVQANALSRALAKPRRPAN